ncbi:hypothetical protein QFZ87_003218 [Bacillus sp. SLBN-46]|uniref:hypothetical protein n=1 Tax=Bacillus sp. SLBN-46 TaxID=3042283 RepID=UPI0028616952|nr:hypothetical protein [Bacillus sp. SLBN-46]MDR6123621.1 hypothetical protein [Bacillus sp. SLBN-46]
MKQLSLADFIEFLVEYRASWNSLDARRMARHSSKDLKVRWANPESGIADWGYEEAEEGWKQAYKMYEGRNPQWSFDDVLIEMNQQQEGVAIFWVRFSLDGQMQQNKLLFVETFRQENGEWKKIREFVENSFDNPQVSQEK